MHDEHLTDVTLSDLKALFFRRFATISRIFFYSALACMLFLFFRQPQYLAESSFKQTIPRHEMSMGLKEAYQQLFSFSSESAAVSIMQSNAVLKNAVEAMGMQVDCDPDSFFVQMAKRFRDRLVLEWGGTLSDLDSFSFRNVSYEDEKPLRAFLKLVGPSQYQLLDDRKQLLGEAAIGEPIRFVKGELTLWKIPKLAKADIFYPLKLAPWEPIVQKARQKFKIVPFKQDKSILRLQFSSRDRCFAADFLNQIMWSYQTYLKSENDETCQEQLAYLRQRESELTRHYDEALLDHVKYLKESLSKNGFIEFAQEIEALSQPKKTYTSKLFDVDLALQRLQSVNASGQNLRDWPSALVFEIEEADKELREAEELILCVENQRNLSPAPSLQKDPKSPLALMIQHPIPSENRQTLLAALREFVGHSLQKKKILEENLSLQKEESHDFSGLNLNTAQELLVEYTRQRDSTQAQVRELVFLRDQLSHSDFEVSSLGGVMNDPVTSDLIKKASDLSLQLRDDENRSAREQSRLQENLKTQKNFLSQYLFQTIELKKLRARLLSDKIASLEKTAAFLLQAEKSLLTGKIHELNRQMEDVPEKWRRESLLMLKRELGSEMLQGISQLAEAKNLGQHVFQVNSRPLDIAYPPTIPQSFKIFVASFFFALFATTSYYLVQLTKQMLRGFPATSENLKIAGFPVSGTLSSQGDDLETLRKVAEFILAGRKKNIVAACIGGKYPNYSSSLAEILTLRGYRVLIIDCLFDKVLAPGLWTYLEGQIEKLPILQEAKWDRLNSGIATRHGAELIGSQAFSQFLSEIKQKYDVVLLYSSAQTSSAEAQAFFPVSDLLLVTVQQETKADLLPYLKHSCTFIHSKEKFA